MTRLAIALLLTILFITPVSALTEAQKDFYDQSGVYYYDPTAVECNDSYGSYDGIPTAGLNATQSAFIDKFHDIAASLGKEYGIPWEAVMAQGIIESAAGTSRFARERNNFFGLGAVDSNPNAAYSYPTPAAGWRGYFDFIKNNPRYRAHGAFNHANDPFGYIQSIKNAGYATDPNYVNKVGQYIKAVINRAKEKNWPVSSDSSDSSPGIGGEGDIINDPNSGDLGATGTCTDNNIGDNDIATTALLYSWSDRSHAPDDPKAEYRQALEVTGLANYGEHYVQEGRSCDAFVAAVLRTAKGGDPNFPCCGAANQLSYLSSHPDLYEEIPNNGTTANLQPGDIRSKPGHIEIVVQVGGAYKIASASHPARNGSDPGRTADHARDFYADSSYRIFRKK